MESPPASAPPSRSITSSPTASSASFRRLRAAFSLRSCMTPQPGHDHWGCRLRLCSPHRRRNRSCCWDTTGQPRQRGYRTTGPCNGSAPAGSDIAGVGQGLGLQTRPDHAGDVQGLDAQGVVLRHQRAADVMVGIVSQALGATVGAVDAPLGFPPAPAARRSPRLGTLPTAERFERISVAIGIGILPLTTVGLDRLIVCMLDWDVHRRCPPPGG